jgi:hypothetical protein
MGPAKLYFWFIVILISLWEIYSVLPAIKPFQKPGAIKNHNYLQGIIHVHSNLSDGGGSPADIAQAAAKAGMDFVLLTDHNTTRARELGFEKRYGDTDLFVDMEASTWAGHCLTFAAQTEARKFSDARIQDLAWKHFIGKETVPGFFEIVSHPSNIKNPWTSLDRFPEGIEVFNFDSMWQRELYESVLGFSTTAFLLPFNPYLAALRFFQVYPKDLSSWDAMNSVSPGHFAILAHDAHAKARISDRLSIEWPTYLQTFKLASNVIFVKLPLPVDFEARRKILYQSIREGRIAMLFQALYPFEGNSWNLKCGDKTFEIGDQVANPDHCEFRATFPAAFPYGKKVRLLKNGDLVQEVITSAPNLTLPISGSGSYRLEVWATARTRFHILLNQDVPYLFYNPIYVH